MRRRSDRLWAWGMGVGGIVACAATWSAVVRADDNIERDMTQAAQKVTGRYVAPAKRIEHYTREATLVVNSHQAYERMRSRSR